MPPTVPCSFRDELRPALAHRVDRAVGIIGMVVGLDQRAAIGGHPLMVVLAAGLDDLAGGGIPELLLVKGVKRGGMGGSIYGVLAGALGCQGPIGALPQVLLEGPACRQSRVTLGLKVLQILLKLAIVGCHRLLECSLLVSRQ